jgi:hypothetical protein
MPPQRTPLAPITSNRLDNHEFNPYQRARAVTFNELGIKPADICTRLNIARSTLQYTLSQDPLRDNGVSLPRSGRPKSYTDADERIILRHVRNNPKDAYKQVLDGCGLTFSKSTLKKILKKHGIANWRAKRRPFLTPAHAAKRLAWCLRHRHRRDEEWGMVAWSDECSVERGRGKRAEWVFRTPAQKWNPEMVQTYGTNKNMKVMVWASFWDRARSSLYIMDRDFESKKHGYSAASYLEVLNAEVAPIFEGLEPGYQFMQDNAAIHTARKVKEWFIDQGIELLQDWPPYSPDLNPIEHIWWHLKARFYDMFPEVAACKSESEHARQAMESCLQAAWDTLDNTLFEKVGGSMRSRIEACIEANGWHTKY